MATVRPGICARPRSQPRSTRAHGMRQLLIGFVLSATVLGGSSPVLSSSVGELPVEFQVRSSDMVVVATYDGESYSTRIDPATKIPYREQLVTVHACPKGLVDPGHSKASSTCPETVTIRSIGGEVPAYDPDGNVVMRDGAPVMLWVPDNEAMPWLEPGEYVLFLTRDSVPDGQFRLYGATKGERAIFDDNGTKMVSLPIDGWELVSDAGKTNPANVSTKSARESRPARARVSGEAKTELPPGPFYIDTIPLSKLQELIDSVPERVRRVPDRR